MTHRAFEPTRAASTRSRTPLQSSFHQRIGLAWGLIGFVYLSCIFITLLYTSTFDAMVCMHARRPALTSPVTINAASASRPDSRAT